MLRRALACGVTLALAGGCSLEFDRMAARGCDETCARCCDVDTIVGGSFDRGWDRTDSAAQPGAPDVRGFVDRGVAPAEVSDFGLDRYEVTRSRFARFLAVYDRWRAEGFPRVGDGAAPGAPTSGWQASYDAMLPADAATLEDLVDGDETRCADDNTFREGVAESPMNCVSWFVAFAFCVWDDGRLATEAEWAYAAAGGAEQRAFPWSTPADSLVIDERYVVGELTGELRPVGSVSDRDAARWGTHDLAGNVREWVHDVLRGDFDEYEVPCADCAAMGSSTSRVRRGGDWATADDHARTAFRGAMTDSRADSFTGIRCAREPI